MRRRVNSCNNIINLEWASLNLARGPFFKIFFYRKPTHCVIRLTVIQAQVEKIVDIRFIKILVCNSTYKTISRERDYARLSDLRISEIIVSHVEISDTRGIDITAPVPFRPIGKRSSACADCANAGTGDIHNLALRGAVNLQPEVVPKDSRRKTFVRFQKTILPYYKRLIDLDLFRVAASVCFPSFYR